MVSELKDNQLEEKILKADRPEACIRRSFGRRKRH